jgi:iron(III) transport system substrate-binding protein
MEETLKPTRRTLMFAGTALLSLTPLLDLAARAESALPKVVRVDDLEKLVAAAKAEGSLTFYTSIAQRDMAPLVKPFEDKYGIKVKVWRATGDVVLQRVIQEQGAKRATVDVIHTSGPEMEAMAREGMLQPVDLPAFADLSPDVIPKSKLWIPTMLSVWVQAYNTNVIRKEDLPKTYGDLLDPKWKGKLGYELESIDWFTEVVKQMGEEQGLKFFRELAAANNLSVRRGTSLLNNLVAAGEVPLALTVYSYMPEQSKAEGAPIDWFVIEPAIARANGIGIAKYAARPNAAALFEQYILTEGQAILADMKYLPTSTKVKSPLTKIDIKVTDPSDKLDNASKWEPLYQRIIVQGRQN